MCLYSQGVDLIV
ncbi:hypothetical protein F383_37897 [Gossypium arboreum]|uniref:Uncharacterized protein n=1 Tax=Gossypium arboreum TaxID=29729 RepID=A0A0B0MGJ1_GOSAR|nr:hypothetical protein F383_37897 [Gossypium arboreum]